MDAADNVFLTGRNDGSLNFGGNNLPSGVFLAKLTSTHAHLWSTGYGGGDGNAVAVLADDSVVFGGRATAVLDFGSGNIIGHQGGTDAFLVRLTSGGSFLWGISAGDGANQEVFGIAVASTSVAAAGLFAGALNLGGGALAQGGAEDAFVVHVAP